MNITDQQIDDIFNVLPTSLQEYILDPETQAVVKQLIEEYDIPNEQEFSREVLLVLLNEISLDDLRIFLETECGLSQEDASDVTNDIDWKILSLADIVLQIEMAIGETGEMVAEGPALPPGNTPRPMLPTPTQTPNIPKASMQSTKSTPSILLAQIEAPHSQSPALTMTNAVKNLKPITQFNTLYSQSTVPTPAPAQRTNIAPTPTPRSNIPPSTPAPRTPPGLLSSKPASILDAKLASTSMMPKQELSVQTQPQTQQKPPQFQPKPSQTQTQTGPKPGYPKTDPYREAIF